ncbi:unnamed protein product [Adineta steineri]|uniref:Uncharacterized protein n=1 Tax=Adineta steineri TaxID=433720 RepID=A0A819LDU2_9BILA|nr:unnamed protein product [Adineta steineri]CAF3959577.1 unnamed protein product [Adineta steineri]
MRRKIFYNNYVCYNKIILLIAELSTGTGSRGGGGGGSGDDIPNFPGISSSSNSEDNPKNSGAIAGGVLGGCAGICILIYGCKWWLRRKAARANNIALNNTLKTNTFNIQNLTRFQSGKWLSRYHQYDKWHDWHQLSLSFNPTQLKVSGNGCDDVGTFKIQGIYSIKRHRMKLTKTYERNTGNRTENMGHKVKIHLKWNTIVNQFEGVWCVKTKKYQDQNKFELKLEALQVQSINSVTCKY